MPLLIITGSGVGLSPCSPMRAVRLSARCSPVALLPVGERIPASLNTNGGQSWARM